MKVPVVTSWQPETTRSNPEEDEAGVKPRGGLKRFWMHPFFSLGIRGEKPIESGDSWFLPKLAIVKPRGRRRVP